MSIEECSPCLGFLLIIRFQDRKPHTSNNNTQHRITTQICCERNLKLMHNEDAEASVLRPPDTYWTNQFFSFTLKFKTFFSRFVFFPFFRFFCFLILVLFVCVCIRFALISSGIGLSHRCSPTPTPTPTASPSPSPEELHHRQRYRHHPIFKVFVSINSARKRVCPGT